MKRESEVSYALEAILSNPENESSWRYLRGLYKDDPKLLIFNNQILEVCLQVLNTKHNILFPLNLLLDLLCHGFQPAQEFVSAVEDLRNTMAESSSTSSLANTICSLLEIVDPIRSNYWSWRRSHLPSEVC